MVLIKKSSSQKKQKQSNVRFAGRRGRRPLQKFPIPLGEEKIDEKEFESWRGC